MSNRTPILFIAHIDEEKEIALLFKTLMKDRFLDIVDVFVSSDAGSISMGQKWLDKITVALETCDIAIIVCSPVSVARPWINFEAGAVHIRKKSDGTYIPVIPLCHSGAKPSALPIPLSLLQGARATEMEELGLILPVIANAIGCRIPKVDFTPFIHKVRAFESGYTYWNHVNAGFRAIHDANPEIIDKLRKLHPIDDLTAHESAIAKLERATRFLTEHRILAVERKADIVFSQKRGTSHGFRLVPLKNLQAVFESPNFVYYAGNEEKA